MMPQTHWLSVTSLRGQLCVSQYSPYVCGHNYTSIFFVLNCLEPAAISPSSHYVMSQSNVNKKLEAA